MRELLQPLAGQRVSIRSRVSRFGCRPLAFNLYGETVLLEDVTTAPAPCSRITSGCLLARAWPRWSWPRATS
jgi:hypothetical protein